MHYSTVKPAFSNFTVITANVLGVRIFRIFTVFGNAWNFDIFFQVGLVPAFRGSVLCHSCSATLTMSATMPAETTNLIGSPLMLPFPWCLWARPRSHHTSVAALYVMHHQMQLPSTVRRWKSHSAQLVGLVYGLVTVLSWWVCWLVTIMILTFRTDRTGPRSGCSFRMTGLHCLPFRLHLLDPFSDNYSNFLFFWCPDCSDFFCTLNM